MRLAMPRPSCRSPHSASRRSACVSPARLLRGLLPLAGLALPLTAEADLPPFVAGDTYHVLTSEYDYSAGSDALVSVHPSWPTVVHLNPWVGDTEAVFHGGLLYVVSRFGADQITLLDTRDEWRVVRQFSVGPGSNPQQICLVDAHRAFVTRYESAALWEVDPSTGQHTDTIDLAPLADADGIPEMHKMAIHAGQLYVTIQRLDRTTWAPAGGACLAVIDLADNALVDCDPALPGVQGIPLAAQNPNSGILVDPLSGDFLIGELGDYDELDGGIERIDPDTRTSLGFVLTEAELGGDLHAWTTGNGWDGYAVRLTPAWSTDLVACDLRTGQVTATLASSTEFAYAHLAVDLVRRELFVCDRTYSNPGLRVFDTATLQLLTTQPIGVGLYPHWLTAVPGPASGVSAHAVPVAGRIEVFPQPSAGRVTLRLPEPAAGPPSVEILDIAGRRVARLTAAGGAVDWDGCDDAGDLLPRGVYWARSGPGSGGTSGSGPAYSAPILRIR